MINAQIIERRERGEQWKIKWEVGGQLWMWFVYYNQSSISSFLLVPIVGLPQIKHERKQVVSIEGKRKKEKPGRGTPSVRKKKVTLKISIHKTF